MVSLRARTLITTGLMLLAAWAPAAAGPKVGDGATLLYDATDGRVLYAESADQPWYPASLTKMMTAYIVFETWASGKLVPSDKLVISPYANAMPKMRLGLGAGKEITYENAVNALIMVSANDIAIAIAEGLAGSEEAFVQRMNETARRLGMFGTRFINPNGLPGEGQYTTARDMALLAQALIRDFPQHLPIFAMLDAQLGKRRIGSHNSVLTNVVGGDGLKTGFTCSAGYNIVASASRNGRRLVAVVLGAESLGKRSIRAKNLLDWGFARRDWKALYSDATIWSLPETAYDRTAVRALNLGKRLDDCREPLPDLYPDTVKAPGVAASPVFMAGISTSAAVAAVGRRPPVANPSGAKQTGVKQGDGADAAKHARPVVKTFKKKSTTASKD